MPQDKLNANLIDKVKKTVSSFKMLKKNDAVLISLSGGPDSVFLTHALLSIRDFYNLKLSCFHLDHTTRDGQSAKDAEFVEKLCARLNLPLFAKTIDAKKWCRKNKMSFQEGARIIRISFLNDIAAKNNIDKIAVGHTSDDSIETFFLNLFRGSGNKGLGGIQPAEGLFIRPLIDCSKIQIQHYLDMNDMDYCRDISNLENIYSRNKIRNMLIPFIKKNIKSGFEKKLINTMKILREEDKYMSCLAEAFLKKESVFKYMQKPKGPEIISIEIPLKKIALHADAYKRRILLAALAAFKGSTSDIKSKSLDIAVKFLFSAGENKSAALKENIKIKKESGILMICRDLGQNRKYKALKSGIKYNFEPCKSLIIKELNIKVFSEVIEKDDMVQCLLRENNLGIKKLKYAGPTQITAKESIGPHIKPGALQEHNKAYGEADLSLLLKNKKIPATEAYLDFEKIVFPVYIINWNKKEGQSFMPLGMSHHKKLHDFFIDEKIPESKRYMVPLFFDSEKIIWVAKMRIDDRVKIDNKTKKILHIKIFDI